MLTIQNLKVLGVDTEKGLTTCMNNESFYLRLVDRAIKDSSFENLKEALENKDYERAFEIAHSLKGVLGNLSLTPLYNIVFELTEILRKRTDMDYSNYINNLLEKRDKIKALTL